MFSAKVLPLILCILWMLTPAVRANTITYYSGRTSFISASNTAGTTLANINIDNAATGALTHYDSSSGFTVSDVQFVETAGGVFNEAVIQPAFGASYQGWTGNPTVVSGPSATTDYVQCNFPPNTRTFGCDLYTVNGNGGLVRVTLSTGDFHDFNTSTPPNVAFGGFTATADIAWVRISPTNAGYNPCLSSGLVGAILTNLQTWRSNYFGNTDNSGHAADTVDYNHDGLPNLAKYAFGLDPTSGTSRQLPKPILSGNNMSLNFTSPTGVSGVTYGVDWTQSLNPVNWQPLTDTGSGTTHSFSISTIGRPSVFLRLKVSEP